MRACAHSHEACNSSEDVADILEPAQVDDSAPGDMPGERETGADGQTGNDEASHHYEGDDAHCPAKADAWDEVLEHDGEDDSARRAAPESNSDGRGASAAEPMAHHCHGRIEPSFMRIKP